MIKLATQSNLLDARLYYELFSSPSYFGYMDERCLRTSMKFEVYRISRHDRRHYRPDAAAVVNPMIQPH